MLRQTLSELHIRLAILPQGPLLIKEGRHADKWELERSGVAVENRLAKADTPFFHRNVRRRGDTQAEQTDMTFVYSHTPHGDRYYLPGSSLRGVLRSAAEQVVGRWRPDLLRDPFARQGPFAGTDRQLSEQECRDGVGIYRKALPIERCFGHTHLRGRLRIADAWASNEQETNPVVRHGVGIDRKTGAAADKFKFTFETLTAGTFMTTLTLVNYELWQLGLLAHVLAALDGGRVQLGYATRRGLGTVQLQIESMHWHWYLPQARHPTLQDGLLPIPSIRSLARQLGDYGWQDTQEQILLPLIPLRNKTLQLPLASSWETPRLTRPNASDGVPWQQLGPLLAPTLQAWSRSEQMRSQEVIS